MAVDGETGEEETRWDLASGRGQECYVGGGESGHMDIHQQSPRDSGTVGGPPAHIQSLRTGDGVQGHEAETVPMVAVYGGGCPTEGYTKIDFVRHMGAEATGIQNAWQEGGSVDNGQR